MTNLQDAAQGLRVLIVEDESLIAEEIQDRLNRLGFKVIGIRDTAASALTSVEESLPDLVLMDIRLKGSVDGIDAAHDIYNRFQIPVVFLTAHSDPATLQRAKNSSPFGYLLKPFQERELLVAIEMAIHRHGLEQRLKESELKYSTTLASIADGVIATDTQGRVNYMNPVAEALTKWRFVEAEGLAIEQIYPLIDEAGQTPIGNPIRTALAEEVVVKLREPVLLIDRTGAAIPIDNSSAVIREPKGRVNGAVLAFRDIRERRLAEDSLRKAEEQLRQSQKMEAVGQLAGGVAHDFNNLLTVIGGYSEILLESNRLDETARSLIREIHKAGGRASDLTRQLLAFSRKQVLKSVVLDLNDLITNLDRMLSRLIGEDVELTTHFQEPTIRIQADPGQIEQVVLNLVINARDAMPQGGRLRVETSLETIDDSMTENRPEIVPGRYVMLAVSDTGTGMDSATLSHLFEPFFTTKQVGRGTGLGLATVYGIIKQFQGHIFVSSKPGHGTTFRIYLPTVDQMPQPSTDLSEHLSRNEGFETILLVEDDPAVRSVAAMALSGRGYTLLTAGSGEEAIREYCKHLSEIDLLITDVIMPNMSGHQLALRLCEIKPTLRVMYVSGFTDDSVIRHGVQTGDTVFIQKPFTAHSLTQKVRELLDSQR